MSLIASVWPRFRPLAWFAAVFFALSTATRLALLVATGDGVGFAPSYWLYAFAVGAVYDAATFVYFAWPLVLFLWLVPRRAYEGRFGRAGLAALCFALVFALVFVAGAEWTFWDEFQTRFNFIAVDYLVYTNEVIGNIRESYPIGAILVGVAFATTCLFLAGRRWRRPADATSTFAQRSVFALAWLAASVVVTFALRSDLKERTG
ncbi:MAG TPA: LTA synthase family protein, partial [Tahibacter sp.]|nr:LTA synthase family protein [Tahibacter sp.]